MILLSEQSFLPFCKEGVVLEKKESVSKILGLVTMYNQKLSQYVKDYRNYGTPQKLDADYFAKASACLEEYTEEELVTIRKFVNQMLETDYFK